MNINVSILFSTNKTINNYNTINKYIYKCSNKLANKKFIKKDIRSMKNFFILDVVSLLIIK